MKQVREVTLFWGQSKARLSRLALTALLVSGATAASADVLVVRASGPSASTYPAGRSLPNDARITLRGGDTLVVLDARGTRTFRGPGTFTPASAAAAGPRVAQTADNRRARIGAVRSAGIVPASPSSIWQIDVSQGGTVCLANTSEVTLWRPDASQTASLAISGSGASRTVNWPAGNVTTDWPRELPIANGARYQLSQAGTAVPTSITFRTLASAPGDMQAVAQALIANGCQEQLDLLVDSAPAE